MFFQRRLARTWARAFLANPKDRETNSSISDYLGHHFPGRHWAMSFHVVYGNTPYSFHRVCNLGSDWRATVCPVAGTGRARGAPRIAIASIGQKESTGSRLFEWQELQRSSASRITTRTAGVME